jgi:hypothetical protein
MGQAGSGEEVAGGAGTVARVSQRYPGARDARMSLIRATRRPRVSFTRFLRNCSKFPLAERREAR